MKVTRRIYFKVIEAVKSHKIVMDWKRIAVHSEKLTEFKERMFCYEVKPVQDTFTDEQIIRALIVEMKKKGMKVHDFEVYKRFNELNKVQ